MGVIPFYGAEEPGLFQIERTAMDRQGKVIDALDAALPRAGLVLDVGAGTGYTAALLTTDTRLVIAAEPAPGMQRPELPVLWVGAEAARLPIRTASLDGAYATWAYFFGDEACRPGLYELHRVVRRGQPIVIVDNAGDDEFCALSPHDIATHAGFWRAEGFDADIVDTAFEFASDDDARRLLNRYFGTSPEPPPTRVQYRVFVFRGVSRGAATS